MNVVDVNLEQHVLHRLPRPHHHGGLMRKKSLRRKKRGACEEEDLWEAISVVEELFDRQSERFE